MRLSRCTAARVPAHEKTIASNAQTSTRRARNAQARALFTVPPSPSEREINASFKEHEERSKLGVRLPSFLGRWKGGNEDLKKLVLNKHYQHALDYFEVMLEHGPAPDVVSYNLIFQVYEKIGTPLDVIERFKDMQDRDILPDLEAYSWVIKAYCMGDFLKTALGLLEKQKKIGTPNARTYALLLDLAVRLKKMDIAESIIKEVATSPKVKPHVEYQNALIHYYGVTGNNEMALKIFAEVISSDAKNYNTFQRLLEILIASNDVKKVIELVNTMVEKSFIPNLHKTKYALLAFYAKNGDPRLLQLLDSTYQREVWEKDGHMKYYRNFIQSYLQSLPVGDDKEFRQRIFEMLGSNNVNDLEDAYIEIVGQATEGVEWEPEFDRYGNVEKVIENVGTQRTDWENKEAVEHLHPDYARQAKRNGTEDQMREGPEGFEGVADPEWPNFSIMKTDEEAEVAYRNYVLSHPNHKVFPPERLNTGYRTIDTGDQQGTLPPHPELGAQALYERYRARKAAEAGELSALNFEKAKTAEMGAYKDQGGYKDTDASALDPEVKRRIDELTAQHLESLTRYDPYDVRNPRSQSSTAFVREERRFERDEGLSPEDEYKKGIEAKIEEIRTKDPKRYERLYRQYRFEVHGESELTEEDLDMIKKNPLKSLMGQVMAVDELNPRYESEEQDVVNTAYRTFNYAKGPDVRFRRMMAVYVSQKMARALKAKDSDRQRREW